MLQIWARGSKSMANMCDEDVQYKKETVPRYHDIINNYRKQNTKQSKRVKVDNVYLKRNKELARLMFSELTKDDITKLAASPTHLQKRLLTRSVSVWTCPYWSHEMQHPEYHFVQTLDGDKDKYMWHTQV